MDRLSDILAILASRFPKLQTRLHEAGAIELWDSVVGPMIAKHARPIKVVERKLWIEVDHPAWKTELLFRKSQILAEIQKRQGITEEVITDFFWIEKRSGRLGGRAFVDPKSGPTPLE